MELSTCGVNCQVKTIILWLSKTLQIQQYHGRFQIEKDERTNLIKGKENGKLHNNDIRNSNHTLR